MPLNTVMTYLKDTLDGLELPLDLGSLRALIAPAPLGDDGTIPAVYIWGSSGTEGRKLDGGTVPRAQHGNLASGGNKILEHNVSCWLVWLSPNDDPLIDVQFPAIIDTIMGRLRNVTMLDATQHARDPLNGQLSNLLDVGENMTWDFPTVRAVTDSQYWRWDTQITVNVVEIIQA